MPVKVLNVAEKPSVAKEVSRILSNGGARSRRGRSQYNPIWEFVYTINGQQCDMVFTSVAGHLMELEFPSQYKRWRACSPLDLYTAPVVKDVPADKSALKENLQQLSRQCQWLVLWLDCDREGENISFEVIQVCQAVNRSLRIFRARFSALIPRELQRALQQLVQPNAADSAAVDARQEIDLRIGASFTRFQTLLLQEKFDWAGGGVEAEKPILSYGPCQFPTLGLIVQRAWEIQSHVAEPFWYIHVSYRPDQQQGHQQQHSQQPQQQRGQRQQQPGCDFKWVRERLFDQDVATMLYEACVEEPMATVMQVRGRQSIRRAPVPLATLEMCKSASSLLRMSGERIMKLAEELYQGGWISYPRTETDVYDPGMDLRAIVNEHSNDARWGAHAQSILNGVMWKPPRAGGHDDKAHPPIHPTKYSPGEHDWNPDKKALYEFVVRHFLASCSKDAVGFETTVTIDVAGEGFKTTGLMIIERNWLDVFTYTTWGGNANLPNFVEGQTFLPHELLLKQGNTQPPPRLAERDLIAAMERYGIGTDATVAEHIQKQLERGYASKDVQLTFWPTPLGESLISAYRRMGLDNLWKPDLRGRIEQGISRIAAGLVTKDTILQQAIQAFRVDFQSAMQRTQLMVNEVSRFFQRRGGGQQHQGPAGGPGGGGPGGGGGWGFGGPGPGGGGGGPGPGGGGGAGGFNPGPGGYNNPGSGNNGDGGGAPGGGGHGNPGPPAGHDGDGDTARDMSQNPGFNPNQPGFAPFAAAAAAPAAGVVTAGARGPSSTAAPSELGCCPRCGSLVMLMPPAGPAAGPRLECGTGAPLCSFHVQLPRAVAAAAVVPGQFCGSCQHGQVLVAKCRFVRSLLPPGLFFEGEYTGCLICDSKIQQLIEMSGVKQRPGAGPNRNTSSSQGGQQQQQQFQQQQMHRQQPSQPQQQPTPWHQQQQQQQSQAVPRCTAAPPPPQQGAAGTFDWGVGEAAKQRKQGTTKRKKSGVRGGAGSSGGTGRGKGSRGGKGSRNRSGSSSAAAAADGGGYGSENAPLCLQHNEPVLVMTSRSEKNPGRQFYKCARQGADGEACLKFAWADEYQVAAAAAGTAGGDRGRSAAAAGGGGGARQRGSSSSRGGVKGARGGGRAAASAAASGGRGSWDGDWGGGGGFVSATGAPVTVCFKCGMPGHWGGDCTNA